MAIDRASFLLMTGALAAGGAGGYYAHQQGWIGRGAQPAPAPLPVAAPEPVVERVDAATPEPTLTAAPVPACDDGVGAPADCPGPGLPTDEGGCGQLTTSRCEDFKASFKPRVAQMAVECVRDLKPVERCDKSRLALCGHLALTHACQDPADAIRPAAAPVTSASPPVGTPPAESSLAVLCGTIVANAGASPLAPTLAECTQTLSGMNQTGRDRMVECMKKHWKTKGFVGCEALDASKS